MRPQWYGADSDRAAVVAEPSERRSRIELELKTGNFQRRSDIRERVTYNYVAHSLIVFFRGLFPVPQLKHDDEDAPHFFKMKSRGTLRLNDKRCAAFLSAQKSAAKLARGNDAKAPSVGLEDLCGLLRWLDRR